MKDRVSKIVLGFLMLLPIISIFSKICYATFNKNAYQSMESPISETRTLDNMIIYAIEDTENKKPFNWVKETFIYTGINEMQKAMGVNYSFSAFLLSYWLWCDVIVIVPYFVHFCIHLAQDYLDNQTTIKLSKRKNKI